MATTSALRIDDELYASAKLVGDVMSRSASQQLAHWARIGRELEASAAVSIAAVGATLNGARNYDSLGVEEQALVRAQWSERMTQLREGLNFAAEFATAGESYSEIDEAGNVVTVTPSPDVPVRSRNRKS